VVSSPPTIEEIGALGRDIEFRQRIGWKLFVKKLTFAPAKIAIVTNSLTLSEEIGNVT
jgi:hypothetical protein